MFNRVMQSIVIVTVDYQRLKSEGTLLSRFQFHILGVAVERVMVAINHVTKLVALKCAVAMQLPRPSSHPPSPKMQKVR